MLKIIAAASLITIATWFATPGQFIFFGILHQIAFASGACLLFIRLPVVFTIAAAVIVFWLGRTIGLPALDHPAWWWTGLSEVNPVSSDYVPVFPWWSASLLGLASAKYLHQKGFLEQLASIEMSVAPSRLLAFLGRNSLVYYLVHQPVMIGFILAYMFVTGQISL